MVRIYHLKIIHLIFIPSHLEYVTLQTLRRFIPIIKLFHSLKIGRCLFCFLFIYAYLKALDEAYRVLTPGGRFMCLEFSAVTNPYVERYIKPRNVLTNFKELMTN